MNKPLKLILLSLAGIFILAVILFLLKPMYWLEKFKPVHYDIRAMNTKITDTEITMDLQVLLSNSYFLDLAIDSLTYDFYLDTTKFSSGNTDLAKNLTKGYTDTLTLPLRIDKKAFKAKVDTMEASDKTQLRTVFHNFLDLPLFGKTEFEVEVKQTITAPKIPEVKIANIDKEKLNFSEARFSVDFAIHNPNFYEMQINSFDAKIDFEKLFIGRVNNKSPFKVEAESTTIFAATMQIDSLDLIKDAVKIIFQPNKEWQYTLDASVNATQKDGTVLDFDLLNEGKMDIVGKNKGL